MAGPFVADRVKETTLTGGLGTLNLEGLVAGFRDFVEGVGNGNSVFYMITDGIEWETGIGTVVVGVPNTLVRNSGTNVVLKSSNGGAAVAFATGSKEILGALPEHLIQQGYVKAGLTAGVSITSGATFVILDWDADAENTYVMHDTGVNPSRLTAKVAGLFDVFAGGPWGANAAGRRELEFLKDGATVVGGDAKPATAALETQHAVLVPVRFAKDEFVECRVRQDSGGNLLFGAAGLGTYFGMRRVGP